MTRTQQRSKWNWVFGLILLIFLIGVFVFGPDALPAFKQRILAIIAASLAGFFGYFLTGAVGLEIKSLKSRLGDVGVNATGGAALFVIVLVWWLSPLAPVTSGTGIVTVRVTVLGAQGLPVDDAKVWLSVGGETQKVAGGWEIEIPESKITANRKITIYAAKKGAFLSGRQEVDLKDQQNIATTVQLIRDTSAAVKGIVKDDSGKGVAGARVNILGHEAETTETDSSGSFQLPAHAASGQEVRLHIEKSGYESRDQYHPAGDTPAYIVLKKQ